MDDLCLRSISLDDLPTIASWACDPEFCAANGWPTGLSEAAVRDWWTSIICQEEAGFLRCGVQHGAALIGFVDLARQTAIQAELGIAIGERALWGRGLGERAARLMLTHAFGTLHLRRVMAEVHATNARSLALMHKLGFRETGLAPELEKYRGAWVQLVRFELNAP
jgi:RimJ/RimL family protein N-acetyltransferase